MSRCFCDTILMVTKHYQPDQASRNLDSLKFFGFVFDFVPIYHIRSKKEKYADSITVITRWLHFKVGKTHLAKHVHITIVTYYRRHLTLAQKKRFKDPRFHSVIYFAHSFWLPNATLLFGLCFV